MAQARVKITCDKQYLFERDRCTLRAAVPGGTQPEWRWALQGREGAGALLRKASRAEAWFTAPAIGEGETFTVAVEAEHDTSMRGVLRFRMRRLPRPGPGPGEGDPVAVLVPDAFAPALSPFLGDPAAAVEEAQPAARIAFCEDAFAQAQSALRRLNRCWIVAGGQGIQAFSQAGEAVPLPEFLQPAQGQAALAVAVMPAGPGPCPAGAPRLVCGLSQGAPGAATRILGLGCDGSRWEWAPEGPGEREVRRTVRDLALDRDGNVFVAFSDDRDILRIDLAGNAILHARLPDDVPGVLAMVLDASTGNLYVGDETGIRQVTPTGGVEPVLTLGGVRHLALHGRELAIVAGAGRELLGLHLETRRLATLLGDAGGPARRFQPALPAAPCAALAVAPEGWCLLAVGQGFATFALAGDPVFADDGVKEGPRPARPASGAARTHRQKTLERFRAIQLGIRQYKKVQRLKRLEARERKPEPPAALPDPPRPGPSRGDVRPRVRGLMALGVLGLCALSDPAALNALAQAAYGPAYSSGDPSYSPYPAFSSFSSYAGAGATGGNEGYASSALEGLNQLGLSCGGPLLASMDIPACGPGYQAGVREEMAAVQAQMSQLFVPPATLGAGQCLRGEPLAGAKERIALAQSDRLAQFDLLNAGATALASQMARDGNAVQAVGGLLLAGRALAVPVRVNATLPASIPAFVLGQVGNGLITGGLAVLAASEVYAQVAADALSYRARYQRWANSQNRLLLNCTQEPGAPGAPAAATPAGAVPSPLPAMADALQQLEAGCAIAGEHGLSLPVCSPPSLQGFHRRNGTLAHLHGQQIPCLTAGIFMGDQAPCPRTPLADARDRSDTFAYLDEFSAEITAVSTGVFGLGYGLFAGAESLTIAAAAAQEAGAALTAEGLNAGADSLIVYGSWAFADGYELARIAAIMRGVQAMVTQVFNAESRAQLDRGESQARASSSGAGPAPSGARPGTGAQDAATASAETAGDTGGAEASAGAAPASGPGLAQPDTSAAARVRPFLVLGLL